MSCSNSRSVTNRENHTITLPAILNPRIIQTGWRLMCMLALTAAISQIPVSAVGADDGNAIHYGDTIYLATNGAKYWLTGNSRPQATLNGDGQFMSPVYTNQNSRGHVQYEWTIHDTMNGTGKGSGVVRIGDEVYLRDNGGGWLCGLRGKPQSTGMFHVRSCNATAEREQASDRLYRWRIQITPDTSTTTQGVGSALLSGQPVFLGCVWETNGKTTCTLLTGARNNGTEVYTNPVKSDVEKGFLAQYYQWKIHLAKKSRQTSAVTEHFAKDAKATSPDRVPGSETKLTLHGYPRQVFHLESRIDVTDTVYKDETYIFPGNAKAGTTPWKLPRSKVRCRGYWERVYRNRVDKSGVEDVFTFTQQYEVTKEQAEEIHAGLMAGFTAQASPFGVGSDATVGTSVAYALAISRETSSGKLLSGEVTIHPGEQVEVWARRVDIDATWDWVSAVQEREGLDLNTPEAVGIAQLSWYYENCHANLFERQMQDRVGGNASRWAAAAKTDRNIKSLFDQWTQFKYRRSFPEMMELNSKSREWKRAFQRALSGYQELGKVHRYALPCAETYTVRYKIDSIPAEYRSLR